MIQNRVNRNRQIRHQECFNFHKSTIPQFKVGHIAKAHTQEQSKAATNEVKKLSYQAHIPFQFHSMFI